MSKTLTRQLGRLEERLPAGVPTKCWRIVYYYPEGLVDGPVIRWGPG
jgi:hypothetical protein